MPSIILYDDPKTVVYDKAYGTCTTSKTRVKNLSIILMRDDWWLGAFGSFSYGDAIKFAGSSNLRIVQIYKLFQQGYSGITEIYAEAKNSDKIEDYPIFDMHSKIFKIGTKILFKFN